MIRNTGSKHGIHVDATENSHTHTREGDADNHTNKLSTRKVAWKSQ
jgi:hypothetical protein